MIGKIVATLLACGVLALCVFHESSPSGLFESKSIHFRRLAEEASEEVAALAAAGGGKCSAADEANMRKMGGGAGGGSFPKALSDCGRGAYSWFRWSAGSMKSCIQRKADISSSCSDCFMQAGQYSYSNCKLQCLFGTWCSGSCLNCANRNENTVKSCAGVSIPTVSSC